MAAGIRIAQPFADIRLIGRPTYQEIDNFGADGAIRAIEQLDYSAVDSATGGDGVENFQTAAQTSLVGCGRRPLYSGAGEPHIEEGFSQKERTAEFDGGCRIQQGRIAKVAATLIIRH